MKSILISIKPKYVSKILNGEKTLEVRLTAPKCKLPIDVYIYCTKDKERLVDLRDDNFYLGGSERLNGKVVAKFTLNKVKKYCKNDTIRTSIVNQTCLSIKELWSYANDKYVYFWHISNLVIFDKPRELKEFKQIKIYKDCFDCPLFGTRCDKMEHIKVHKGGCYVPQNITSAPQSWMYIEGEER